MVHVTMPEGQHPQEPAAAVDGGMVRACDRCGTICSADQEWCLACGVRMSPVSTRLPGLRAAGVVVSLAVLLAGGAAAASYAALRSDTSTTAAAPAGPAGTPVTPAQTPPPVTPAPDPATTAPPVDEELPPVEDLPPVDDADLGDDFDDEPADPDLGPDLSADLPADPVVPDTSGDVPPVDAGGDATDATDTDTGTDTTTDRDTGAGAADEADSADETGPIELASGQGSLYDPDGIVADRGDEGRAIDGNVKTSWRATLVEGKTGGFGYVLDFDASTALKTLTLHSPTEGLKVKILGTTRKTLPATATDAQWVELAPLKTLKGGAGASTDFKLDGAKKLRHVLVLIAETPGAPARSQVNEIQVSR